ncbi:hypothetical protein CIPAW_10G080300 [Carya illinoinensis]|uniref:Uncharacterized protein n=1 Tax=Carya illinoinensis TaxID=32201 RepID=A0A8T1PBT5_CARIL|nr:hypothetical protein CIPAW_10G080300 [Carya illinoinensis]
MDIPEKLMQYRYHVSIAVVPLGFSLSWPLFASTTVFLVAIIAFGSLSQFATQTQGEKADEDQILDCVQGPPIHTHEERQKFEQT